MRDFEHSNRILPRSEISSPIQWLACEPAVRIVDRDYWQMRVDQGLTVEELCYFVRKESQYSRLAWKLLVQQGASLDHFRHIAVRSLHYQSLALKYIHDHCRDKDDLLFVLGRSEELRYSAARKCIAAHALTPQELCEMLALFGGDQQIELLNQIRTRHKQSAAALLDCSSELPGPCKVFLEQVRSETEEGLRTCLTATKRKGRIKAAQKLVRQFPTKENYRLALGAIETDAISQWIRLITKECLTDNGINWRRASMLLPERPPIHCNECIDLLCTLGKRRDALRTLLIHSKGFRRFAAAGLLALQPVSVSDIALILVKAPYRYRKRATQILLQKKGVSLRVLVLAWRRTYDMRADIERILLRRKSTARTKEYLAQKAPDLSVCLNRHRGHP